MILYKEVFEANVAHLCGRAARHCLLCCRIAHQPVLQAALAMHAAAGLSTEQRSSLRSILLNASGRIHCANGKIHELVFTLLARLLDCSKLTS